MRLDGDPNSGRQCAVWISRKKARLGSLILSKRCKVEEASRTIKKGINALSETSALFFKKISVIFTSFSSSSPCCCGTSYNFERISCDLYCKELFSYLVVWAVLGRVGDWASAGLRGFVGGPSTYWLDWAW
ncbi:hypothetical protein M5K25_008540 [Dendrobium thyrsiflorum]|uniref:Uncharacterized protein n=1 Tax=Dendrobium thyrsiflorum TaxID=117978 RepID=A0ABD0V8W4_DENTH